MKRVRRDKDNPKSRGYICQKAGRLPFYANDRALRLTSPLRRNGAGGCDEACGGSPVGHWRSGEGAFGILFRQEAQFEYQRPQLRPECGIGSVEQIEIGQFRIAIGL
jgi:hypothetical protein